MALQEQQAASRAKSGFLAVVSHALRTRLRRPIGYTALLLEDGLLGSLSQRQRTSVARLRECSVHLQRLVGDLPEVAAYRTALRVEPVDLCGPLLNAIEIVPRGDPAATCWRAARAAPGQHFR